VAQIGASVWARLLLSTELQAHLWDRRGVGLSTVSQITDNARKSRISLVRD